MIDVIKYVQTNDYNWMWMEYLINRITNVK